MRKTLFIFILLTIVILSAPRAGAQNPELFITWRAENYTPPGYSGRVLPSVGTPMEASFELVDGGKIIDVSKYEIRWLFGDRFYKTATGLKTLSYAPSLTSESVPLKITVVGYNGGDMEKEITIPIARPEIVIAAPYPNREIGPGKNIFRALPYFFNIQSPSELSFEWLVNKEKAVSGGENPDSLELDTPEEARGLQIALSVFAQGLKNPLELAS